MLHLRTARSPSHDREHLLPRSSSVQATFVEDIEPSVEHVIMVLQVRTAKSHSPTGILCCRGPGDLGNGCKTEGKYETAGTTLACVFHVACATSAHRQVLISQQEASAAEFKVSFGSKH